MYLTGSNLPYRKFTSSQFKVARIDSSSAWRPSTSRAFVLSSRTLSSDTRSAGVRADFAPPVIVGTPIQSWNAVSSPASHLRRASSLESPPATEAPIHAFNPPSDDSPLSHAAVPRSSVLGGSDCFVPQTTHSPCGLTSPPHTRQTCETVPSAGFTAIGPVPP